MGTNFYFVSNGERGQHIGKRSAAGPYCWDCQLTLCRDGEDGVHYSKSIWFDKCQNCGAGVIAEDLHSSSVGLELGFNKRTENKHGVKTCSSFTFAMKPNHIMRQIEKSCAIIDEYGRNVTWQQFLEMLHACPIYFYDMIGRDFS